MKSGTERHPKTLHVAEILHLPVPTVLGHLELLWSFTAQFALRGDVGRWGDVAIERALLWTGENGALIQALTTAGFLDKDPQYRLITHDWADHAPDYIRKRLKRQGLGFVEPGGTSPEDGGGKCPDNGRRSADNGEHRLPTQPNPTQSNPTTTRAVSSPTPSPKPGDPQPIGSILRGGGGDGVQRNSWEGKLQRLGIQAEKMLQIVARVEAGDLSIERVLKEYQNYERAIALGEKVSVGLLVTVLLRGGTIAVKEPKHANGG